MDGCGLSIQEGVELVLQGVVYPYRMSGASAAGCGLSIQDGWS